MKMVFNRSDCERLKNDGNYENKFVILSLDYFAPEYKEGKNQLFYATGGFGCYPDKLGGKIFGRFYDEMASTRREYVLGIASEKAILEWEQAYGMSRDVFLKKDGD